MSIDMKAFAITIKGNKISEDGYKALNASSSKVDNRFFIEKFNAVTPENVDKLLDELSIKWTWPHSGSTRDTKTGILKHGYGGKDPKRRKACGMSHYLLWKHSVELNEPILIFEHDSLFQEKLNLDYLHESSFQIIGLNSPYGATRLPAKFDKIVQGSKEEILHVPTIDKPSIAQGIAGNSSYLLKPNGGKKLLELVKEHGMWNNDAIMCQQLMPDMLGVTKTYYTRVQNLPSTTMG